MRGGRASAALLCSERRLKPAQTPAQLNPKVVPPPQSLGGGLGPHGGWLASRQPHKHPSDHRIRRSTWPCKPSPAGPPSSPDSPPSAAAWRAARQLGEGRAVHAPAWQPHRWRVACCSRVWRQGHLPAALPGATAAAPPALPAAAGASCLLPDRPQSGPCARPVPSRPPPWVMLPRPRLQCCTAADLWARSTQHAAGGRQHAARSSRQAAAGGWAPSACCIWRGQAGAVAVALSWLGCRCSQLQPLNTSPTEAAPGLMPAWAVLEWAACIAVRAARVARPPGRQGAGARRCLCQEGV
jgi:hypothetical protein